MAENQLKNEKSPYLLQHATNPVDWYAWNDEAFLKASSENKPIFLSIGYSTCHWCHVMAHESFENEEVASILNKYFVAIKVDREERPDIDNIYMSAVQVMTGSGGWPLSVFLTPNKEPFYGGTYFPLKDSFGRPGFKTVLTSLANKWKNEEQELIASAKGLVGGLKAYQVDVNQSKKNNELNSDIFDLAYADFKRRFDNDYGGFEPAHKFPMGYNFSFLLRYYSKTDNENALSMVTKTLDAMLGGGIYDQIGGGFHRYATDRQWHVPHFEKMLYDQALLVKAYLEAYQLTHDQKYKEVVHETLEFVVREMLDDKGGFYSALDADSAVDNINLQHKSEGAFYVWEKSEILALLGVEKGKIFNNYFGVVDKGNVQVDHFGEFKGKNILYKKGISNISSKDQLVIFEIIKEAKKLLFASRYKRPYPHLDDKVLTDWNGLMISSFSSASRILNNDSYLVVAKNAADFVLKNLYVDGNLYHRYRDSNYAVLGNLADYSFFSNGLLDLYEVSFDLKYLAAASTLALLMIEKFWDNVDGGFYFTAHEAEVLLFKQKELYDGAIPSGNSMAVLVLLRLARLTGTSDFEKKIDIWFNVFAHSILENPIAFINTLIALDYKIGPSVEIVLVGDVKDVSMLGMINTIYSEFIPNKAVIFKSADNAKNNELIKLVPWLADYSSLAGKATAYICKNFQCERPTISIKDLKRSLGK